MLDEKYLKKWNKLCPECPINAGDLSAPTEALFTRVLVAYLRLFHYKVEPTFQVNAKSSKDDGREKRSFLLKLIGQIQQILMKTDITITFAYYDLIQPTSKKFSQILNILLDYYFFYDMFKTNVLSKAQHHIEKVTNLQDELAELRSMDERKQLETQDLKKSIEMLQKDLLNDRAVLEKSIDERNAMKQKHIQFRNQVSLLNSAMTNLEHKTQCFNEKKNLQAEIKGLELEDKNGEIKLNNILQEKQNVEAALKENNQKVLVQRDLKEGLKKAISLVPNESIERLEDNIEKLELAEQKLKKGEAQKERILIEIKEFNLALEEVKLNQMKTKENYLINEQKMQDDVKKLEGPLLQKSLELDKLKNEIHSLECEEEKQREILNLLLLVNNELFDC